MNTANTAEQIIKSANLDWSVQLQPLFYGEGEKQSPISRDKAVVRADNNGYLGTVGANYTIVQNNHAFSWFDGIVQAGKAKYTSAGQFNGGRSVWIKAEVAKTEVAKGDVVSWQLLLRNTHDGSGACRAQVTPLRLVCTNGLTMVDVAGQTMVSVRHTKNALIALHQATEVLTTAQAQIAATRTVYEMLAKAQVNAEKVKRILDVVFPQEKKQELVLDLFEGQGVGLDLEGAKGTAWGLYNSITEAVDHHLINTSDADKHLEKIMVGTGADTKSRALKVIRELVLA